MEGAKSAYLLTSCCCALSAGKLIVFRMEGRLFLEEVTHERDPLQGWRLYAGLSIISIALKKNIFFIDNGFSN